jgi:hypothetical protein
MRRAALIILWIACAALAMAQVKTETTEQKTAPAKQVTVERAEVVYVSGNDVVFKMENGEIRHLTVPDNATATVDGKTITLADLKPGMKLQRTITTTTVQQTVKTVRSGQGTVTQVSPPNYVTVRFEDNTVERYKVPKGTTFNIDGQKKTVFDLKAGMKISATRVVEEPMTVVSQARNVTGSAPPPPPEVPANIETLLIPEAKPLPAPTPTRIETPAPAPAAAAAPEPAPKKLPTTGSLVPLIGLLGLLFSGASFGLRLLRRS